MKVKVNGKEREAGESTTLQDLILSCRPESAGVVAVLNGAVVAKETWAGTPLRHDDRVELLSLVAGG